MDCQLSRYSATIMLRSTVGRRYVRDDWRNQPKLHIDRLSFCRGRVIVQYTIRCTLYMLYVGELAPSLNVLNAVSLVPGLDRRYVLLLPAYFGASLIGLWNRTTCHECSSQMNKLCLLVADPIGYCNILQAFVYTYRRWYNRCHGGAFGLLSHRFGAEKLHWKLYIKHCVIYFAPHGNGMKSSLGKVRRNIRAC